MEETNASSLIQTREWNTANPEMIIYQTYAWPIPLTLPDANKGPEAVMKVINEWFKHQELTKLLQSMESYNSFQLATTSITSTSNKTVPNSAMELPKKRSNNILPRDEEKRGVNEPQKPKTASKNQGEAKDSKLQLTSNKHTTSMAKMRVMPPSNKMEVFGK